MKNELVPVPKFKTYQEEAAFWQTHNLADYLDFYGRKKNLYQKNLQKNLTVRFSLETFGQLKKLATKKGLGVTSFIRHQMMEVLSQHTK